MPINLDYWDRYDHDQLRDAFALVKNKENWKLPIDAIVPGDTDMTLLIDAISYYTGGLAEAIPQKDGTFRVLGSGYYNNIGS